jgi:hypothetical protein
MELAELNGKSYKFAKTAQLKLEEFAIAIGNATCLVAYNPIKERYLPVVIYRDGVNVGMLIHNGITVIN